MYGVVLGGGGARGAYQVGAWQALRELGIEYGGVAGSSVGALNGAMMVQGDFDRALEVWSEIRLSRVVGIDDGLCERLNQREISPGDLPRLLHLCKGILRHGVDTSLLRDLLAAVIDEARVRAAGLEFGFVAACLPPWKPPLKMYISDVPGGQLVDYLLAGACLPIFKRQYINGRPALDGGLSDRLPVSLLTARGFKRIIAVRLGGSNRIRRREADGVEVTYITPRESLGGTLEFSPQRAARNIKLGYFDTLRVLRGYRGRRYYLEVDRDEGIFGTCCSGSGITAWLPSARRSASLPGCPPGGCSWHGCCP
jgi:NTE family protein